MILNSLFYHVIAFRFEEDYEALRKKIPAFWEPAPLITGENDVYSHVAGLIEPAAKGTVLAGENRPLGVSLEYRENAAGDAAGSPAGNTAENPAGDKAGVSLSGGHDLAFKDRVAVWTIEKAGLVLFHGGLGFFWFRPKYESLYVKISEESGKEASGGGGKVYFCARKPFTEADILDANNALKEYSYSRAKASRYVLVEEEAADESVTAPAEAGSRPAGDAPGEAGSRPAGDASAEAGSRPAGDAPAEAGQAGRRVIREVDPGSFRVFRDMFVPLVSSWISVETFFADRKTAKGDIFPDKARLFSFLHLEEEDREHRALLIRLAKGYNNNYMPRPEMPESGQFGIYRPFDNSCWYAAQEGVANLTFGPKGSFFSTGNYRKRLETYFFIFILILMQYCGMLSHAARVGELPSSARELTKRKNMRKIQEYLEEENIFYLKNMFSQVSHITQHNEFYSYAQRRMQIPEMEKELREELDSMDHMLNRKVEREREGKINLAGLLAGVFIFVELVSNVFQIVTQDVSSLPFAIWRTVYGCLIVLAFGLAVWFISEIIKKWWEKRH